MIGRRPVDPISRFWALVDRRGPDDCWPWKGRLWRGYGRFFPTSRKAIRAHRYAYELLVGPIPDGLTIDHLCRNTGCVNPAHLEPVTNKVNILRSDGITARFARASHCLRGHPFDEENTCVYVLPTGGLSRRCRECVRVRRRLRAA